MGHSKKKRKLLPIPPENIESALPRDEYEWLNQQQATDPSNKEGIPQGLEGISELGAIAWIRANCVFAAKHSL